MILFTLKCAAEHRFEGWFRDNAAFERQNRRGLIACPECGSNTVEKAPMAPRLGRSSKSGPSEQESREPPVNAPAPAPDNSPPSPAQLRRALQVLRRHVEQTCENVGARFAEEARRIHKGDAEARGIYGEATRSEAKALIDEGIEVASIPWVPTSDA
ncbi:MAG TPA: DUF1178 family protein [Stellaceae bacterium]|nr:DUF1178 family protein [Stellaceae bacterium]